MPSSAIARPIAAVAACLASALACFGALAAEDGVGVYLLGIRGPFAGIVPAPGLYLQNDVYLYSGSASASKDLPFNGNLVAGVSAKMFVDAPTLLLSTPVQIAGGNLAFSATLPIGGPDISAALALAGPLGRVISRNLHDSIATVGDPYVSSLIAWHAGTLHWNAGVSVNVPIGDYHDGALANIAFHCWAADLFAAMTWFDPKTGFDLSGAVGITFNGENPVTHYRTGDEFHAEFAASQNLPNGLSFGLVGYFYDQITGASGSGAVMGPFKGRVAALGGMVGYMFKADGRDISTRVRVYREFDVQN